MCSHLSSIRAYSASVSYSLPLSSLISSWRQACGRGVSDVGVCRTRHRQGPCLLTQLEVALIYLFDDCNEQVVQQPKIDDLCDLFNSTTRDVATSKISEWDSSMFVAKGASAALVENMSVRLEIIKGILAVDEQLVSPKLLTHSKRIHFETVDNFHEEAAYWRRLCAGQFTTDEEYIDMKNYVPI